MMLKVKSQVKGFTLIELLIAITIVGILSSIAYPSYVDSVRSSRRVDGTSALLALQLFMEKGRTIQTTYANTVPNPLPTTQNGFYVLSAPVANTATFTILATPSGDQANDACGTFAVDQNGPILNNVLYADGNCWGI